MNTTQHDLHHIILSYFIVSLQGQNTSLHRAAGNGHQDVCKRLLEAKADVNAINDASI